MAAKMSESSAELPLAAETAAGEAASAEPRPRLLAKEKKAVAAELEDRISEPSNFVKMRQRPIRSIPASQPGNAGVKTDERSMCLDVHVCTSMYLCVPNLMYRSCSN